MVRIDVDLLRKRAEHNDGRLSNLVEIALHQQNIEKIEVIGDYCRDLEILYLQNNLIQKIENLHHLKRLKYLNLAINCIKRIEGLSCLESLEKLDLTLNFISDLLPLKSELGNLRHLKKLFLIGNPCDRVPGYREFVILELPQLEELDGKPITPSERIAARQAAEECRKYMEAEREAFLRREAEIAERIAQGLDPIPPRYNEKGERVYGHTAEERLAAARELEEKEREVEESRKRALRPDFVPESIRPPYRTPEEEIERFGRVLQRNEAKIPFKLWEGDEAKAPPAVARIDPQPLRPPWAESAGGKNVYLHLEPGKYISSANISVNVQPTFVRVEILGRPGGRPNVLQLLLPAEVAPDRAEVERSRITGHMLITMPKVEGAISRRQRPPPGTGADSGGSGSTRQGLALPHKGADISLREVRCVREPKTGAPGGDGGRGEGGGATSNVNEIKDPPDAPPDSPCTEHAEAAVSGGCVVCGIGCPDVCGPTPHRGWGPPYVG